MSILAVGSIAFDSIVTPHGQAERILGGSATHFALGASKFAPVSVVAIVGDDFPEKEWEAFQNSNIDTSGVQKISGQTFSWGGKYSNDFHDRETLFTHLGVFEQFEPQIKDEHKSIPTVFLGNITPEIQLSVLRQINKPRLVCMDTMNFWIQGKRTELLKTLEHVDILIINDSEALELAEELNLESAAKKIVGMIGAKRGGSPLLVVKQAEQGATVYGSDKTFHVPAYPVSQVVDPTGAGDSFAGGFVGYLSRLDAITFDEVKKALCFGCSTASFNLENFGPEDLKKAAFSDIAKRFKTYDDML